MAGAIVVTTSGTALTPAISDRLGHHDRVTGTLHFSTVYVAGGDSWTAQQFGLYTIETLNVYPYTLAQATTGYIFAVTIATGGASGFIQILVTGSANLAALGEIANGDYHTLIPSFEAWGH